MKNFLSRPSVQTEIERTVSKIGPENAAPKIQQAVGIFTQKVETAMNGVAWGTFRPNTENWWQELRRENVEFFKEQNLEQSAAEFGEKIDVFLEKESSSSTKLLLMALASQVMLEYRLQLHKISQPPQPQKKPNNISPPTELHFDGIQ